LINTAGFKGASGAALASAQGPGSATRRRVGGGLGDSPLAAAAAGESKGADADDAASGSAGGSGLGGGADEALEEKERGAAAAAGGAAREWGEFRHLPGRKFFDFEQIRREIVRETDRLLGGSKGVSAEPIVLHVYSPHVLNLTLVDLPGLTKVPVGDQPSNIEAQIRDIVLQYVRNPNSIIVAVSAANNDIANSDALKVAREVDPTGQRTLGVLTKLDLMDAGTDAVDVLLGRVVPLRLGFVGVVNRSQQDIVEGRPIHEARKAERAFFAQHPAYKAMQERLGTAYLTRRLNALLLGHIRQTLPDLKARVSALLGETQLELDSYGEPLRDSEAAMAPLLLTLLSRFSAHFCDALDGRSPDVSTSELYGGARISFVFHEVFAHGLDSLSPFDVLSDADVRNAIRTATGPRPHLFVPEISFELLVKKQIQRLLHPSLQCVDLVLDELQRVTRQCERLVPEMARFPRLRARAVETVLELVRLRVEPTKVLVRNIIDVEAAYINTNHPDFIGGARAVAALMERMQRKKRQAALQQPSAVDDLGTLSPDAAAAARLARRSVSAAPVAAPASSPAPAPAPSAAAAAASTAAPSASQDRSGLLGMLFPRSSKPAAATAATGAAAAAAAAPAAAGPSLSNAAVPAGAGAAAAAAAAAAGNGRDGSVRGAAAASPGGGAWGLNGVVQSALGGLARAAPTDRELIETEIIKSLIQSYFDVTRVNVEDAVPKAIMYSLVNHCKEDVQRELVRVLYSRDLIRDLMAEGDDVAQKRTSCAELVAVLRKALEVLAEVRDFQPA
jgi:dynamin 1-like protein